MDFTKVITANEVGAYWNATEPQPYFGEMKFPTRKKRGLKLDWIKGAEKAPVSLSLSAFDANSIPLARGEFELLEEKMPFFKNHFVIDEDTIMMLQDIDENASAAIKSVIAKIFADSTSLRKNAALTREILRMSALTTGVISLSDNGQTFSFDYKVPNTHKQSPTVKWNVATADPLGDIEKWQQIIAEDTGETPTEILMNSKTFSDLMKTDAIKSAFKDYVGAFPSARNVRTFISDTLGVTTYIDDDNHVVNGTKKKLVPDGTVVLMPTGDLGFSWFGTTPEENRLQNVSVVDSGVALTAWHKDDPVASYIKASQVFLPSFERADAIFIASVL